MAYISVDIDVCRKLNHHLEAAWSDKTPLKVSLSCIACSLETGMSAFAAYGVDTKLPDGYVSSFGTMRRMRKTAPIPDNSTADDPSV